MTSIRLSSNVEILRRIFRELLEKEGEESVDIFASSYSVADRVSTVRVTDINRLIKEDDRCI
jgi:hypothetical protein